MENARLENATPVGKSEKRNEKMQFNARNTVRTVRITRRQYVVWYQHKHYSSFSTYSMIAARLSRQKQYTVLHCIHSPILSTHTVSCRFFQSRISLISASPKKSQQVTKAKQRYISDIVCIRPSHEG